MPRRPFIETPAASLDVDAMRPRARGWLDDRAGDALLTASGACGSSGTP